MRAPTSALLTAAAAAAGLLTACASTTPTAAPTDNPSVGITTHSVVTSGAGETATATDTVVQVNAWWNGGGKQHLNAIAADFGKIHTDGSDATAIGTDCATLSSDVSAAQSFKAIPDDQAQHHWSAALDHFQQAATDCTAGVSASSVDLINKAGAEIQAGTTEFNATTTRITQLAATG